MNRTVSVIGLGYVGLPVAVAFGKKKRTIGFDLNTSRIQQLQKGFDKNNEITEQELKGSDILFTSNPSDLKKADFHIVAVPTPVDKAHVPDLKFLISASETVGKILKKSDIVVYESTVYPGATEETCLPILESLSGLKGGQDFWIGYSPERINPGDPQHPFTKIKKVVSGQDERSLKIIAETYASVVEAGVYPAKSIKVAEAAKVIENTQRDLNIALMNELSLLFKKLNIDTNDVLDAASTKWNFLKFTPGLVGGHCIGVDPYYLTFCAEKAGLHPQVILAGRRINDGMSAYVAQSIVKELIKKGNAISKQTVTVLGLTFKENIPDLRNSKVADVINELRSYSIDVQIHDPHADPRDAVEEYGFELTSWEKLKPAQAVVCAVAHNEYKQKSTQDLLKLLDPESKLIFDIKSVLNLRDLTQSGARVWRL